MARGDTTNLLVGFHGRLNDDLVIKQRNGKPVLCCYPKGKKIKWTANQEDHRRVFKRAVRYARNAIKNPERLPFTSRDCTMISMLTIWPFPIS